MKRQQWVKVAIRPELTRSEPRWCQTPGLRIARRPDQVGQVSAAPLRRSSDRPSSDRFLVRHAYGQR